MENSSFFNLHNKITKIYVQDALGKLKYLSEKINMDHNMTCYVYKSTRVLHTLHIKYVCNYLKKKIKEFAKQLKQTLYDEEFDRGKIKQMK